MQPHPSTAYLRLSEGPEDLLGAELSLTRRLLTFFVALVLFSGTSLFATAALDLDHGLVGKALAANAKASHDGDGDNSGPGGGGDDDDDDEADDNRGHGDTNNAVTGGGASHSDDNDDGDSDSSDGPERQAREGRRLELGPERRWQTDSSHGQQVTDSNSDENHNGASDSSGQGRHGQATDSGTDDNHNGNTDSGERGERRAHR